MILGLQMGGYKTAKRCRPQDKSSCEFLIKHLTAEAAAAKPLIFTGDAKDLDVRFHRKSVMKKRDCARDKATIIFLATKVISQKYQQQLRAVQKKINSL